MFIFLLGRATQKCSTRFFLSLSFFLFLSSPRFFSLLLRSSPSHLVLSAARRTTQIIKSDEFAIRPFLFLLFLVDVYKRFETTRPVHRPLGSSSFGVHFMFPVSAALLLLLFVTHLSIDPSACALPANIQNLELDDITSLWNKFPSIIGKIQEAGRTTCDRSKATVKGMLFE